MVFTAEPLDGETLAALGAATGENGAAALGGHAGAEAVGLGTLPRVGLVRTLHIETSRGGYMILKGKKP